MVRALFSDSILLGTNRERYCSQSYTPSDTSLVFNSTSCRAGDLVLQNRDTQVRLFHVAVASAAPWMLMAISPRTQASVTCSFSADGGCTKTAFFVEVAELTNATLVGPWTSE